MVGRERIRKNFQDEQQAQMAMLALRENAHGLGSRNAVITALDEDQVHEAELAYRELAKFKVTKPLHRILIEWLDTQVLVAPIRIDRCIELYLIACENEKGNKRKTIVDRQSCLESFVRLVEKKTTDALTTEDCRRYIFAEDVGDQTKHTRRSRLHAWFVWMQSQGFVASNIVSAVETPKFRRGTPGILTVAQIDKLLNAALVVDRRMLPYFAVCALSGVRPAEATRLDSWDYFEFENSLIHLPENLIKENARFTRMHRRLRRILKWCKRRGLEPGWFRRKPFVKVRKHAGLDFNWSGPYNDVLRHSYASHVYAIQPDLAELAKDCGNSPEVLKRSYIALVRPAEGYKFLRQTPNRNAEPT